MRFLSKRMFFTRDFLHQPKMKNYKLITYSNGALKNQKYINTFNNKKYYATFMIECKDCCIKETFIGIKLPSRISKYIYQNDNPFHTNELWEISQPVIIALIMIDAGLMILVYTIDYLTFMINLKYNGGQS